MGKDTFLIDRQTVDLRYVEQLVDSEQTAYLAQLLKYIKEKGCEEITMTDALHLLETQIKNRGLSSVLTSSCIPCGYALPRVQEIYACFNRYRG